ncbi:RluA family pseudouridine synthase [Limibacter armeniacum]|uniref:RluA family pseudouridine synthase n=1 Tax=Limibacter armeniacum TaxID=466084 RepID=UPI002FE633A7
MLYEHEKIIAGFTTKPTRLDHYLSDNLKNKSRSMVQAHIKAGKVTVNGKKSKSSYIVKGEDEILWMESFRKHDEIVPLAVQLNIFYETADIIVINKPAGMPMHPGLGNYGNTLLNALQHYYEEKGEPENLVKDCLVQRIDKNTTGIVAIPKHKEAYEALDAQFSTKSTLREYQAIVWGNPVNDEGTLRNYMGRNPQNLMSIEVSDDKSFGKEAVTHYKVLKRLGDITLVSCRLETGRTHQIRLHMKHLGHPLVGDERYFMKGVEKRQDILKVMTRHALHAKTLGFVEPFTGKELVFDSELPQDFSDVLSLCK